MYNLFFENGYGERRLLVSAVKENDIITTISSEVKKMNPNFKIYYIRSWNSSANKNEIVYDVGSHTEYFIAQKAEG